MAFAGKERSGNRAAGASFCSGQLQGRVLQSHQCPWVGAWEEGGGGAYTPGCVLTSLPSCSDSHAHIHYLEDCILHHPAQEGHFLIASMLHPVFSRLPTNSDLLSAALIRKDCRAHLDRGPVKIESSQKVSGADAAFHDRVCLHSVNIVRWQETTAEGGERDQSQGVRHEHPQQESHGHQQHCGIGRPHPPPPPLPRGGDVTVTASPLALPPLPHPHPYPTHDRRQPPPKLCTQNASGLASRSQRR